MAEVAGLVLGVIPLAIWALEKYAEPLEQYCDYRNSIETFCADLELQRFQLERTLSNIGLHEPSSDELRECLDSKFPKISGQLISTIQRMDKLAVKLMKKLDVDPSTKPDLLPDKIHWEWRRVKHSFSAKRCKTVIDDLRNWNEDLRQCTEKAELPAQDDSRKVQDLTRRFNIKQCDSVRQWLSSLYRALQSGFLCTCPLPHQAAIDIDWKSYKSTAMEFKVTISYGTDALHWRKLCIAEGSTKEVTHSTPLVPKVSEPVHGSIHNYISKFNYRKKIPGSSRLPKRINSPTLMPPLPAVSCASTESVSIQEISEVATLCTVVSSGIETGSLKDSNEEPNRDFSFRCTKEASEIVELVTLKSLLNSHHLETLSAKERHGIAASTAWSVLHLSDGPWLSTSWDENQASMFVEKRGSGREELSQNPCVSCVFSDARVANSNAEDDAMDMFSYYIPNRTIFTLGVLLVELCLNRPLAEARRRENRSRESLIEDHRVALKSLDEVYRLAGHSYGDAVARCIKCSFTGRDAYKKFDMKGFRQEFYDTVVAPIQATYLQFPN